MVHVKNLCMQVMLMSHPFYTSKEKKKRGKKNPPSAAVAVYDFQEQKFKERKNLKEQKEREKKSHLVPQL